MFVILLTYIQPLDAVDRHMKAHMVYLRECYKAKVFITSGRRVPRTGGVILARAPSKEDLTRVVEKDPFITSGVATYEIIEFKTSQHDPAFAEFIDP